MNENEKTEMRNQVKEILYTKMAELAERDFNPCLSFGLDWCIEVCATTEADAMSDDELVEVGRHTTASLEEQARYVLADLVETCYRPEVEEMLSMKVRGDVPKLGEAGAKRVVQHVSCRQSTNELMDRFEDEPEQWEQVAALIAFEDAAEPVNRDLGEAIETHSGGSSHA